MNYEKAKDARIEGCIVVWTALGRRTQQTMRETFSTEEEAKIRLAGVGDSVSGQPTPIRVERGEVEVRA